MPRPAVGRTPSWVAALLLVGLVSLYAGDPAPASNPNPQPSGSATNNPARSGTPRSSEATKATDVLRALDEPLTQLRNRTEALEQGLERVGTDTRAVKQDLKKLSEDARGRFRSVSLIGTLNLVLWLLLAGGGAYWLRASARPAATGVVEGAKPEPLEPKLESLRQTVSEVASALQRSEARHTELLAAVDTRLAGQTATLGEKLSASGLEAVGAKATQASTNVEALRQELTALRERVDQLNTALGDSLARFKQKEEITKASVWPQPFLEPGSLAVWRGLLEQRLERSAPQALGLFGALVRFNHSVRQSPPSRETVAAALRDVSLEAYAFWRSEPGQWDLTDSTQAWSQAFQRVLDSLELPLDIKLIFAKDRFDMNTMRAAEDASESRISVKEPLSWIIRDTSGAAPTVLEHGRVTTC
jgi:prefoldin subunit 5